MNRTKISTPEHRSQQAAQIIKNYAFRSSVAGFVPIPLVDTLGLIGIQRLMLFRLSKLYGVPFKKNLATISLSTLTSSLTVRAASPLLGSALKMIPGVGTLAGGASMAALNSASTYVVGKVFQQHYEQGGTLKDFDPEQAKSTFEETLKQEKAREAATKHPQ